MKRKCLKMLVCGLTTAMIASGLVGCSGCKESEEAVTSENVISREISEEISEEVFEETTEEVKEEVSEDIMQEVYEESSEEKETVSEEHASGKEEETSTESPSEEKSGEASETPSEEEKPSYTVEAMSAIMYAQRVVNVRKGPSTEYEKIGGLALNQEVTVTGKASTGWYEISYNGEVGYVSNSYLGSEKVVEQPTPVAPSAPAESTTPPAGNVTPPASTPTTPPADSGSTTPTTPTTPSTHAQETYTAYLDTSFLGLVNSHRTANGVREVTWNSGMEQVALARIEAMARSGQLNHAGNPGSAEVLAINFTGSSSEFMSQYLASSGHYSSLLKDMNAEYGTNSMVAATCKHTYGDTGAFTEYYNVIIIFNDYNDEWADVFN